MKSWHRDIGATSSRLRLAFTRNDSCLDIYRAAHWLIKRDGDDAPVEEVTSPGRKPMTTPKAKLAGLALIVALLTVGFGGKD